MTDDTSHSAAMNAIVALKARYFRMMDTKNWAGLEAVFTDDLEADFRESTSEYQESLLIHGVGPYLAMLVPMLSDVVTVHHGHMPEIEIESADSARGVWAMEDWLWPGPGSALPFRRLHGWGHYHERYRRIGGEWKIAAIRLTRLRIEAE